MMIRGDSCYHHILPLSQASSLKKWNILHRYIILCYTSYTSYTRLAG